MVEMYGPNDGSCETPSAIGRCSKRCRAINCDAVRGALVGEKPYSWDRVLRFIIAAEGIVNRMLDG